MVQEAAQNKADDDKRKALIEARNQGDSLAYQSEKSLKDLAEKVDPAQRADAESKIKELRDAVAGSDADTITRASQALQDVMQTIGQAAYQQQAPEGQPEAQAYGQPQQPGAQPDDEDVVEGEFHDAD